MFDAGVCINTWISVDTISFDPFATSLSMNTFIFISSNGLCLRQVTGDGKLLATQMDHSGDVDPFWTRRDFEGFIVVGNLPETNAPQNRPPQKEPGTFIFQPLIFRAFVQGG